MFSVVYAVLPSGPRLPLHQSHEALPGRIHEVSWMAESGFRLVMTLDSISRPGSLPTMRTRHAEWCGRVPTTDVSGSSRWGARRDSNLWLSQPPEGLVRYMAA